MLDGELSFTYTICISLVVVILYTYVKNNIGENNSRGNTSD